MSPRRFNIKTVKPLPCFSVDKIKDFFLMLRKDNPLPALVLESKLDELLPTAVTIPDKFRTEQVALMGVVKDFVNFRQVASLVHS